VLAVHEVAASAWTGNPIVLPGDTADLQKILVATEEMVGKTAAELGQSQPASVRVRTVNGFPVHELIEASRDADLVVVGSRGAGGFARLLQGSVSSQVAQHALCPVVVVPHEK
jgi:nucleotide-binding universal stress UspA family protein